MRVYKHYACACSMKFWMMYATRSMSIQNETEALSSWQITYLLYHTGEAFETFKYKSSMKVIPSWVITLTYKPDVSLWVKCAYTMVWIDQFYCCINFHGSARKKLKSFDCNFSYYHFYLYLVKRNKTKLFCKRLWLALPPVLYCVNKKKVWFSFEYI